MQSNGWKARLNIGLALWITAYAHQKIAADVSNTPEGMLIYHGSAALFDLMALVISAHLLAGRLSDDMQSLCLIAIFVNSAGWFLYMAYAPPRCYQIALLGVNYGQCLRLLIGDSYDDYRVRAGVVYRDFLLRSHIYTKKEKS